MTIGKQETNTFFKLQRAIQYNKACYTCTKSSPLWVNVTLSIFVCTDCAGKQRFDPKYKLKSTVLDLWLLEDLKRVKAGGNRLALKHKLDLEDTDDYIQMLDSLTNTIENIYETEASVESEIAVEVEEKKMPKLGCVVEKRKVTEKQVREVTKEVEKKPVKTFSIKTNDYDFVDTEWTQSQEIGQKQESKYSYKNMQVQRKVKEKGKLDNVKDALKNATHKGTDLVGYLDVIEEEDTLDNCYRNIERQNQVEYSNVDDNDTASLVVQPKQKDTHEGQKTVQIEDEGIDRSSGRVTPEDKTMRELRENFLATILLSGTPQTLNKDGDNLNESLESTDIDVGPEYTIPCIGTGSQKHLKPDPPTRSSFLQPFQKFTSSCDIDIGGTVEPPIVYQMSYTSVPTKRAELRPRGRSISMTDKANCENLGDSYKYLKQKINPDQIQPVTTLIGHKIPGIYKTTDEMTKESATQMPVYQVPNSDTQDFVAKEHNDSMGTKDGSNNKAMLEDTGTNLLFRTKHTPNPQMFLLEDDEMILSRPIRLRKERSVKPTRIEMETDTIVQQLFETQDSGAKNNIEETCNEDCTLSKNSNGVLLRKQRPSLVEQRHQHQNARSMLQHTQVKDEKPSAQQTKPVAVVKNSKPAELQTLFMEELNEVTKRIADMKNKNSKSGNASVDIVKPQIAVKSRLQNEDTRTYNPISLAAITKSTTASEPSKASKVKNRSFPYPLYIPKNQNEGVKQNFLDLDHVDISRKHSGNQDLLTSVIQKQSTLPSLSVKRLGNTTERNTGVLPFTSAEKYKTHGDRITNFTLRAASSHEQMEASTVGKPVEALMTSKKIQSIYNTPVAAVVNRSFSTPIKDKQSRGPKPLPRISSFKTSSISTELQKSSRHMFNGRHMKGYSTDKSTGDFDDNNGIAEEQRISERQRCNSSATNKPHTNNIDMTKFDDMLADLNEELDSWAASINYYPGKKKGPTELRKN